MKITVRAHPRSKFEKIIEHEGIHHTYFNMVPQRGAANEKIIEMLADYFKTTKSDVVLIFGKTSRDKLFEINAKVS